MDFLMRKMHEFRVIFSKDEKVEKKREITRFEGYFEVCYKILSWEDISLTLVVFLVLNFIFWLVIQLQLKFFGVIFLLALVAFLTDTFFENNQRFIIESSHLELFDDFKNDCTDIILTLKALRKDSPSSFCIGMSLLFLSISFIARNISGYLLCYLVLLGIFFIPLGLTKIPPQYLLSFKQFIRGIGSERGVLAEDELIPFISDKDFNRGDSEHDSLLTDKTADSVTSSLISGLNSMPSHMDGEDKESLEEDDLLPGNQCGISYTPGDISSESDSENRGIRFESTHFNGDTSSEEENYSKNLNFSSVDNRDSVEKDIVSNLINVGDNLFKMASMIKNVVSNQPTRKDSSSDSDFEIINSEEVEEH